MVTGLARLHCTNNFTSSIVSLLHVYIIITGKISLPVSSTVSELQGMTSSTSTNRGHQRTTNCEHYYYEFNAVILLVLYASMYLVLVLQLLFMHND